MLDTYTRKVAATTLEPTSRWLAERRVRPMTITLLGLGCGVAACVSIAFGQWSLALGMWLLNRVLDGLDGLVARRHGSTDFGGFADIVADFIVYSGFVVAVAFRLPETRFVAVVLLMAYYVSGAAFLAWSDLINRRGGDAASDERTLNFLPGIAEGTETIVVYAAILLVPSWAVEIMWAFVAMVTFTAGQRVWWAAKTLR